MKVFELRIRFQDRADRVEVEFPDGLDERSLAHRKVPPRTK
jgi:hypothetical protein